MRHPAERILRMSASAATARRVHAHEHAPAPVFHRWRPGRHWQLRSLPRSSTRVRVHQKARRYLAGQPGDSSEHKGTVGGVYDYGNRAQELI